MSEQAEKRKAALVAETQENAEVALVGRTVVAVEASGHDPACDSVNVLTVHMADGSTWRITGFYGGYTGNSCDEYIELLDIKSVDP